MSGREMELGRDLNSIDSPFVHDVRSRNGARSSFKKMLVPPSVRKDRSRNAAKSYF